MGALPALWVPVQSPGSWWGNAPVHPLCSQGSASSSSLLPGSWRWWLAVPSLGSPSPGLAASPCTSCVLSPSFLQDSSLLMCFLCWEAQNWTQHSPAGLTSAAKGTTTSLKLLAQSSTQAAPVSAAMHHCLFLSSVFTRIPRPFLQGCSPAGHSPAFTVPQRETLCLC